MKIELSKQELKTIVEGLVLYTGYLSQQGKERSAYIKAVNLVIKLEPHSRP